MARHALMPNVDDNQDVLYTHALQKGKQFLSTAFFVTIIVAFGHIGGLIAITHIVLLICVALRARRDSVGDNAAFSLGDTSFACDIV